MGSWCFLLLPFGVLCSCLDVCWEFVSKVITGHRNFRNVGSSCDMNFVLLGNKRSWVLWHLLLPFIGLDVHNLYGNLGSPFCWTVFSSCRSYWPSNLLLVDGLVSPWNKHLKAPNALKRGRWPPTINFQVKHLDPLNPPAMGFFHAGMAQASGGVCPEKYGGDSIQWLKIALGTFKTITWLGGSQLKCFLFSPRSLGEMIQFDSYFSNGLVQPPARWVVLNCWILTPSCWWRWWRMMFPGSLLPSWICTKTCSKLDQVSRFNRNLGATWDDETFP